jgi:hypothetical protein
MVFFSVVVVWLRSIFMFLFLYISGDLRLIPSSIWFSWLIENWSKMTTKQHRIIYKVWVDFIHNSRLVVLLHTITIENIIIFSIFILVWKERLCLETTIYIYGAHDMLWNEHQVFFFILIFFFFLIPHSFKCFLYIFSF